MINWLLNVWLQWLVIFPVSLVAVIVVGSLIFFLLEKATGGKID